MGGVCLENVRKIMMLGGGDRLVDACGLIGKSGLTLLVVTSKRFLDERISHGRTLQALLQQMHVHWVDCDDPCVPHVLNEIDEGTVGISVGAPWIFSHEFIVRFGGRLFNLHSTSLPRYRGGASYSWMILMGERRGASVLHQVAPRIDAGDIVLSMEYEYPEHCRVPQDFFDHSREYDLSLLAKFIILCGQGSTVETQKQNENESTYFPRLATGIHGYIDWGWTGSQIVRFANAFDEPYGGASTFLDSQKVRIKGCMVEEEIPFHPFQSGLVFRRQAEKIVVAASKGSLSISLVADSSGKDITAFVRPGMRFYTPRDLLDEALASSAIYTPRGMKICKNKV
jgi:methionyl-tRNA formyltransferase